MSTSAPQQQSRRRNTALWTLQVVLATAYALIGASMLMSTPQAVAVFDQYGWGDWLRYLVGAVAVLGAVALVVPGLCRRAAVGLAVLTLIMIAAHTSIDDYARAVGFVVPLALTVLVVIGRRGPDGALR